MSIGEKIWTAIIYIMQSFNNVLLLVVEIYSQQEYKLNFKELIHKQNSNKIEITLNVTTK